MTINEIKAATGIKPLNLAWLKAALQTPAGRELDWSDLPTYGGERPACTFHVWSWSELHVLVGACPSDLEILPR